MFTIITYLAVFLAGLATGYLVMSPVECDCDDCE